MKLTFIGAAHEVTGSCFYLEACDKKILIDCGMEQGGNEYKNQDIPVASGEIDYVLLTHAHIDHSGNLPLLTKNGFKGEIHCTEATEDLCNIMLRDSAHIQEFEAEWRNRKAKRAGDECYVPVYTMDDAIAAIQMFVPHPYNKKTSICEGISIRFIDAGHLLGSSSIEVWITENGISKKIVFSGDIGNINKPIIKNPQYIEQADFVVMESTYGNRNHGERPDYVKFMVETLQETFDRGGNVVIPSFAVGRTQEMLYFLREIKEKQLVKGHNFTVYVDSPLAIEATNVFKMNSVDCYDDETKALLTKGINPISFEGLKIAVSQDESRMINFDNSPKVIISASGMCDAGRIKHHLKHNLWRSECTILFVGYQSVGSMGRKILDGADKVKLFGETIDVKAQIKNLQGISGHADRDGLLKWAKAFIDKPEKIFVVHGDFDSCEAFAQLLNEEGFTASAYYSGTVYDLAANECIYQAPPVKLEKSEIAEKQKNTVFVRLTENGKRLLSIIKSSSQLSNKDLAKFNSQLEALCEKWKI